MVASMFVREDVKAAIGVIAEESHENAMVERLMVLGYSKLRAEVLLAFVPLGLARAVITRIPSFEATLSDIALIRDFTRNETYEVPLRNVPQFISAWSLGEETFSTGIIPKDQFQKTVGLSVELRLISDALDRRDTIAEMSAPVLMRLANVPGFRNWYKSVTKGENYSQ